MSGAVLAIAPALVVVLLSLYLAPRLSARAFTVTGAAVAAGMVAALMFGVPVLVGGGHDAPHAAAVSEAEYVEHVGDVEHVRRMVLAAGDALADALDAAMPCVAGWYDAEHDVMVPCGVAA